MTSPRIMVTGSRTWTDRTIIRMELARWFSAMPTIVHGDARGARGTDGADRIAAEIAVTFGYAVEPHPADWSLGRSAGMRRNIEMLGSDIDHVVAFNHNNSPGTAHAFTNARVRLIPTTVYTVRGDDYPGVIRRTWEPPPTLFEVGPCRT
jgi:hypothetical protein